MLCLAPTELVTEAERRLCRVLAALGPGSTVLGGLAVFVPVVDGAMQRRQADAVVFLPETLVVVRAVAMGSRQSGELRPNATGMWTVGGDVLRLSGGGANPTASLRKAVDLVQSTLSAGGLYAGLPPALAVIDGSITSVRDRSAGGPVACSLDAGEVLTGLRHCSNLGSQADRRLWTTADVRAALAIFGLHGRGPSVEDLNNEGFLYSPYVLRKAKPVALATASAASQAPPVSGAVRTAARPSRSPEPAGPNAPVSGPSAPRAARASTPSSSAVPPASDRTAVPTGYTDRPQTDPPDTDPPDTDRPDTDRTGGDVGLGGLFGDGPETGPPPTRHRWPTRTAAQPRGARRRRPWLLVAAVLLVVAAGVGGLLYAFGSGLGDGSPPAAQGPTAADPPSTSTSTSAASATTPAPVTQLVGDVTFTLAADRADTDCALNSYGQVAEYFVGTPCAGLTRTLYTVTLDGQPAVVSVSEVVMPSDAQAAEFRTLVDTSGTGNVSDLLRAGVPLDDGPSELVAGAYSSRVVGSTVRIVEVAWVDEAATGSGQALEAAAEAALSLQMPST